MPRIERPSPRSDARGSRSLRARLKRSLGRQPAFIVLSDLDGTLAPIRERPGAVRLPPETRRILARLARHPRVRLGILSGRSLRNVQTLVRIPGIAYGGCHGLEIVWGKLRFRHPGAARSVPVLRRVTRELRRRCKGIKGALVEVKGLTVSLHFRRVDPTRLPRLQRIVRDVMGHAPGLEILKGKKVLELRPRVGWGKGKAAVLLRALLAKSLGRTAAVTVCLGDDETDEDAFRSLRGKAICVAVGRRRTQAPYRLVDPRAVRELLGWLADLAEQGSGGGLQDKFRA